MRLLVDECCRRTLIEVLRSNGLDAASVSEVSPSVDDHHVLALARRERRILITDDKDFGELAVKRQEGVAGVILLRTRTDDGAVQAKLILDFLAAASGKVAGYFTVIEDSRYRQRPLESLE